jgi:hypothetical protein
MIINFLYNTVIELVIAIYLFIWLIVGCTIIIPFIWNFEGDYWDASYFIKDMRSNKMSYEKQTS